MLQEYLKVVDDLTINEENRLKRQVEILQVKKSEFDLLKEQVQEGRQLYHGLKQAIESMKQKEKEIMSMSAEEWRKSEHYKRLNEQQKAAH
jgi:hypothetical protein